ncbi:MAG: carboxypeptidase regulatory-like domain-containing protein, partial [Kofleriaceae bacterium]
MTRKLGAGIIVLIAAAAIVFWWRGRSPTAAPHAATPGPPTPALIALTGSRGEIANADPTGTLRLEGQVIDAADQPVAGASVTIDAVPPRTVKTEADGTFVFDTLLQRRYELFASAPSGTAGPVSPKLDERIGPIVLKLRPGAAVDAKVFDIETGSPIANATVEVRGPVVAAAITDAEGLAKVGPVTPGTWSVVAVAPGYAKAYDSLNATVAKPTPFSVGLAKAIHLRGRVVDAENHGVANALIWINSASDWVSAPDPMRDGLRSASDGTFEAKDLARGSYVVHAVAPAYAGSGSVTVTVSEGASEIVVKLSAGAHVAGRVVGATGATVRVTMTDGARTARVDATGAFRLDGLPAAVLWVSASDERASSKPVRVDLTATSVDGLELKLDNEGTIAGTVIDTNGDPVESAQITALRTDALDATANLATVIDEISDSSGHFTLHGLVAGEYKVVAARDSNHGEPATAIASTGTPNVVLQLPTPGAIHGKVAFKGGGAPGAYTVRLGRAGVPAAFSSDTFTIDAPAGSRSLWIEGSGFAAAAVNGIDVKPGQTAEAGTIALERGRTIAGHVSSSDGTSLVGAEVIAGALLAGTGQRVDAGDGGPGFRSEIKRAPIGPDGTFRITGAATTELSVVASVPSGSRSTAAPIAAGTTDVSGVELTVAKSSQLAGTVTLAGKPTRAIVNAQAQDSPLTMFTVMAGADGSYHFDQLAPGTYTVAAITGEPLAGSPFYPHAVSVGTGKRLDIAVDPGEAGLAVTVASGGFGLVFVTTQPGAATNALALLGELGRQDGGQWAMAPVIGGAAKFSGLGRGPGRAC